MYLYSENQNNSKHRRFLLAQESWLKSKEGLNNPVIYLQLCPNRCFLESSDSGTMPEMPGFIEEPVDGANQDEG